MCDKFIFTHDHLIEDYHKAFNCLGGVGLGRRAFGPKPSKLVYPERGERYKEMIIDELKDERDLQHK